MYMSVCLCVHHMHAMPKEVRRGLQMALGLEIWTVISSHVGSQN